MAIATPLFVPVVTFPSVASASRNLVHDIKIRCKNGGFFRHSLSGATGTIFMVDGDNHRVRFQRFGIK